MRSPAPGVCFEKFCSPLSCQLASWRCLLLKIEAGERGGKAEGKKGLKGSYSSGSQDRKRGRNWEREGGTRFGMWCPFSARNSHALLLMPHLIIPTTLWRYTLLFHIDIHSFNKYSSSSLWDSEGRESLVCCSPWDCKRLSDWATTISLWGPVSGRPGDCGGSDRGNRGLGRQVWCSGLLLLSRFFTSGQVGIGVASATGLLVWFDSLLKQFRLGGHQDGGSGSVLTSFESPRLGCWLGAGPGALQGRISLWLVKLLWLKPGRFTTYWDLELEYPWRRIWKRTEVQQILWNFMISFSFQSFEKGWVGERAAVLGKAPPSLSSSRKWAPGRGRGLDPERGVGEVWPPRFSFGNWIEKTKQNWTQQFSPLLFLDDLATALQLGSKYCTFEYYTLKHFFFNSH